MIADRPSLEQDLHNSPEILELVKNDVFAQHLYAAMCNTDWYKDGHEQPWGCSWRYAGGVVADLRNRTTTERWEDYLDWYCSGILLRADTSDLSAPQYSTEGQVSDDVKEALRRLGWSKFQGL